MGHVVLLGDSIFDNERYVPGRPPVIEQLRELLPRGWRATLLAVDGTITSEVARQIARLPADASHLVVSVGGNDALENSSVVDDAAATAADGFTMLAGIQDRYRQAYREMLGSLLVTGKPTVICTIYDAIPGVPPEHITALSVFNDVILREGFRRGLPILDLRLVCDEARDYSSLSPIEPSEVGGAKIARGIRRVVTGHDFERGESVVYAR